jgi:hypothetical protein
MIKFIQKIGFFRLMLVPIGIAIIITAVYHSIIGMGIVGTVVLGFGLMNKCLLLGNCELPEKNKD